MNKDIQDAYDYDDPIDRPMIDEQRDEQECKHEETRHLYADHIESRKAVAHDCDMIICCDCGATITDCLDSTELCDECQLTREDCGEEGECEGMHDRITKCSCIRCEKKVRDEQECKHEETRYANDEQDITGNYCFNIAAHDCTVIICSDCKLTIKECLEVSNE